MAEDFGARLDRLMSGEPPFQPGEETPRLSQDLLALAQMLRDLKHLRG
ncbi:MAG TPA: hypothetical protein VMR52_11580 [Dehalococcoidia bacterium]|nr:hypothetical protein [Dehalococcoidia bacterium]